MKNKKIKSNVFGGQNNVVPFFVDRGLKKTVVAQ